MSTPAEGRISPLMYAADNLPTNTEQLQRLIEQCNSVRPLAVRIANFSETSLILLARLDYKPHVIWKIDFLGEAARPQYIGLDTSVESRREFVSEVQCHSSRLQVYSFNSYNRRHLESDNFRNVSVVPISADRNLSSPSLSSWNLLNSESRAGAFGRRLRVGMIGTTHPDKGIVAGISAFLASDLDATLRVAIISPPRSPHEVEGLISNPGSTARWDQVHIRVGRRREYQQMNNFYADIDVLVVNSRSDSWGRVVSEAAARGVALLVRRARCGTNFITPEIELFDELNFESDLFRIQVARARRAREAVQHAVLRKYNTGTVMRLFLDRCVKPWLTHQELAQVDKLLMEPETKEQLAHDLSY